MIFINAADAPAARLFTLIHELKKFRNKKSGGGSFNLNLKTRNGALFSTAVVGAASEGRLLLRDAARLLNINKISTLNEFAKSLNG
ncbi:hypothetical protein [Endozoicomonas sp. YOMI1]|uniref:hypothetical protein n=1 Tax=Endozoicomonas sp. YOMI1 TaxID=2828739 RepID=UPI0021480307|nr:hypothetical protein [Endozoicomonas sp. YOMI1]